jgi:L-lysine exporter family protein LysE/ArgO
VLDFFLQGLLLGFAFVVPIGPLNIYLLNHGLRFGNPKSYTAAGMTIFFDLSLAAACFLGLGYLLKDHVTARCVVLTIGVIYLLRTGWKLIKSRAQLAASASAESSPKTSLKNSFVLTWMNPQALIEGSIILGSIRLTLPHQFYLPFLSGFAIATIVWYLGISVVAGSFKDKVTAGAMTLVNRCCGLILIVFSIRLAIQLAQAIL